MRKILNDLEESINNFPNRPGCYEIISAEGKIIYVGKAKNLKARVKSYFSKTVSKKTKVLMRAAHKIEFLITNSEYEALILECNLIKKYKPYFNINLKDDKGYPMLRITNEEYPRIFKTRKIINDGSIYLGPYTSAKSLDKFLEIIGKLYKVRKCRTIPLKERKNPCIYYHMKLCLGPCFKNVLSEYKSEIEKVKNILLGSTEELETQINQLIKNSIKNENFERAILLRDAKSTLKEIKEQQVVSSNFQNSRDYLVLYQDMNQNNAFAVMKYREGKLIEKDIIFDEGIGGEEDLLTQFIMQYYSAENMIIPREIYVAHNLDFSLLEKFLLERKAEEIKIMKASEEEDLKILNMTLTNSIEALKFHSFKKNIDLEELRIALKMDKVPRVIEGFDIAHLSGYGTVASMVYFLNGKALKSEYRLYKIKSLEKGAIDDYASIKEVIARRYLRLINEERELPDLILIDGGKGQLSSALKILEGLAINENIEICSLAKREEIIFSRKFRDGLKLSPENKALKLLQNIRDEAHRRATNFNKKLREDLKLSYEEIKGVGKEIAKKILLEYPNEEDLISLSEEEISNKLKISKKIVLKIKEFLKNTKEREF